MRENLAVRARLAYEQARAYENAPCFNALLGEDTDRCGCPSCGLDAIRNILAPEFEVEDE